MHILNCAIRRGGSISTALFTNQHGSILFRYSPVLTDLISRCKATQKVEEEIDLDTPVKFSTSRAATWKSRHTFSGNQSGVKEQPWYEPLAVLGSVTVFLVYFCILREESDVDTKFDKTLYEHIPGLEETQLRVVLEHNSTMGKDTEAIQERLVEIERARMEKTSPEDTEKPGS